MESDPELLVEKDARAIRMSMETVYKALLKARMLDEEQENKKKKKDRDGEHCQYHKGSVGHSIQDCQGFLGLVQEIMNKGKIEFCKELKGQAVNVLQGEAQKPIIIYYWGGRPRSSYKSTGLSHPQGFDKGTNSFPVHK